MPLVRAERLAFSYGDAVPILDAVDVHLAEGFTGLVGENGAGKSTLLRLVAGELTPSSGRLRVEPDGARIVLCVQGVERPGADVHALARGGDATSARLVAALRLHPADLPRWDSLSPGERRRWQVGAALARDPDVLLLDEPTNHLDEEGRALIVAALRRFRGVGLLVSHDRALLEALTVRTLRIAAGGARLYAAPYGRARALWEEEDSTAWSARNAAQEAARAAARRLDAARRAQASAQRGRGTGRRMKGPKDSDARTLGATTLAAWAEDRAGRKVQLLRRDVERLASEIPDAPAVRELGRSVFVTYQPSPKPWLLELDAPSLRAGEAELLRDVRVRLGRGDRVHLAGANGAGKTTLLRALLAASRLPAERILHLPQELEPHDVRVTLDAVRSLEPERRGRVLSLVAALGADPARLLASGAPSPGEARKLALALGLGRHAWAVLLDEPTNHLDLPSIERLEAALVAYPGALLMVTHDAPLAARCTTATWRIVDGRVEG
jgi:ATPase subunit of ABC transporter with duplicated ATPase domains